MNSRMCTMMAITQIPRWSAVFDGQAESVVPLSMQCHNELNDSKLYQLFHKSSSFDMI